MTEPDRTGGVIRLRQISGEDAEAIMLGGLGAPKLYKAAEGEFFAEPAELECWRAGRLGSQQC